ncbi:hypothetical protein [Segetibacter koreensis]|uniref:hypothetical protein n=1 Tax=Segetibacter koreensis TaxID=398037 RepID=UPI0003637065|nr:hypothetical protein [Segetibacter koreensis]
MIGIFFRKLISSLKGIRILAITTLLSLASCRIAKNPSFVIVSPGFSIDQPTLRGCILSYTSQGISLKDAINSCGFYNKLNLGDYRDPYGPFGAFGENSTGVESMDCKTTSTDPRLGSLNGPSYYKQESHDKQIEYNRQWKEYQQLLEKYEQEWKSCEDALKKYFEALGDSDPKNDAAAKAELDKIMKEVEKTEQEIKSFRPSVASGDDNDPNKNGTGLAKIDPDAQNACNTVNEFVAQCNQNGWRDPVCRLYLKRMEKCGDPLVTDPIPDGEVNCKMPAMDEKTIKRVVFVMCQKYKKPVPGEEPCRDFAVQGTLYKYYLRPPKAGENATPCNDPLALTTEAQCTPNITVAVFGKKDIKKIIEEGRRKLGGPIFVMPLVGPSPGGPK